MTGVYIHIPYCKRKCDYCSFVSFTDFSDMRQYVEALETEIKLRAGGEAIDTVYIGGGTPSVLFSGAVKSLLDRIKSCFSVQNGAEITIEANPESVTNSFVDECIMSGINRVSMGLQSANDNELNAIGRIHNVEKFLRAYTLLKEKGIENINIDLMLGLPRQTLESAEESVKFALSLKPEHISIYALSVEKGCKMYGKFAPDEDLSADMYSMASELIIKGGLNRYEVSNFAREGRISRHNYKYWTGEDYYGFGTAAHSLIRGIRYENPSRNTDYITHKPPIKTILGQEDILEEYIMLRLRLTEGINLNNFFLKFGYRLEESKAAEIKKLSEGGFIEQKNGALRITDKGFYVMNQIILRLL